ncbi:MAG: acetamidase/formamidase family protein [Proteobacteria bacterium]|nr:acetamidase/formamidase family protein [Pseudomonadota bacterium]MBI3495869.1 acetamidase/formamidase family protein [Pseudomonadota bacterium]
MPPLPVHILGRERIEYAFDRSHEPLITVTAPCELLIDTHNSRRGRLNKPEDEEACRPDPKDRFPQSNPMTGPVGILGAEPGDALAVDILDIQVDEQGYVGVFPEVGIVQDVTNRRTVVMLPVKDGQVHFKDLRLPLKPMIGAMACAPAGEPISVGLIGRHGGNMDNNRVTVGTKVHLPIRVGSALFYVGDVHATMGDAEMSGSGAEIGARVHLKLELVKGAAREWPWMETADRIITTASAPKFEAAAELATSSMMILLQERLQVSAVDAFALLSIAGDLRVNQYCSSERLGTSVRMEFPKLNAGMTRA